MPKKGETKVTKDDLIRLGDTAYFVYLDFLHFKKKIWVHKLNLLYPKLNDS